MLIWHLLLMQSGSRVLSTVMDMSELPKTLLITVLSVFSTLLPLSVIPARDLPLYTDIRSDKTNSTVDPAQECRDDHSL